MITFDTPSHTEHSAVVELSLGEAQMALQIHHGSHTQVHALPLGIANLAQQFGHRMPSALALENAIAMVEDAIMPAVQWLPAEVRTLSTSDFLLSQLIQSATGQRYATEASREAIESLFNVLVRQAEQPGYADAQLPQNVQSAAALLVLRECLHHWSMFNVRVLKA